MNSFGTMLRLTTFGESHGSAIGGVLDGMPAQCRIDLQAVQHFTDLRRPGRTKGTTQRQEPDRIVWLSGMTPEGTTLGSPIAFLVQNEDARSRDYDHRSSEGSPFRANHADLTYFLKYGLEPQPGGGRASGRETVARVIAGGIVQQWLTRQYGVEIQAFVQQVGAIRLSEEYQQYDLSSTYDRACYCPDPIADQQIYDYIQQIRAEQDSVGGSVRCVVRGLPAGLGEPLFDRLPALLSYAVMSIPGSRAFAMGDGFSLAAKRGSQVLDPINSLDLTQGVATFGTNHNGGSLGGISTGADLLIEAAFKPTPTIARPQQTVTTRGHSVEHTFTGRHDPCIALRAVPVVQAMVALTLGDLMLQHRSRQ